MLLGEVIEKVNSSKVLDERMRNRILSLLASSDLNGKRLLARFVLWLGDIENNAENERLFLQKALTKIFTSMNESAIKVAKKETYAEIEAKEKELDLGRVEEELNELDHE